MCHLAKSSQLSLLPNKDSEKSFLNKIQFILISNENMLVNVLKLYQ